MSEMAELKEVCELAKKHGIAIMVCYKGKNIDFQSGHPMIYNTAERKQFYILGDKSTVQEFSEEYDDFPNGLGYHI